MVIAGADGCKAGWAVAVDRGEGASAFLRIVDRLESLFADRDAPDLLTVDIPIGLSDAGPRDCDVMARRRLGRRGSSVFPAPIRPVLQATDYADAQRIRREVEGKGMSKQAWAIVPKIAAVDVFLRERRHGAEHVREVHPEVCFFVLAGRRELAAGKKTEAGRSERKRLLAPVFGDVVEQCVRERDRKQCAADDVIDAFVALWTARRIRDGLATVLPGNDPPRDRFGLPMEMVA
jgi:predicted RNase H-like nuclease